MLIVRPDHTRRVDLPGAGLCPRPVDIDRTRTGFASLVALRVYAFARGAVIDGEAEGDELFIVLMRGKASFVVSSGTLCVGKFLAQREGGVRAIYMPPHSSYRLSAVRDSDIAYARVKARGTRFPGARGFTPTQDQLEIVGYALGMDLALITVQAGQVIGRQSGARLPERFVHVRSDNAMSASIAGEPLDDWDSVSLQDGESAVVEVGMGTVEVLTIGASASGSAGSKT